MSVYVDNARIPARVGRIRGRWSHLISDNPDLTELHTFAAAIGLRRAWFQPGPTGRHPHYDLTETKRAAAIAAGAVPVSWHQVPGILAAARAEPGTPQPRVLVTGSRTWTDTATITARLAEQAGALPGAVLVHGDAAGADRIAARIWRSWGLPEEPHPADWHQHGRAAGPRRNAHMVALGAAVCLAFIHNHSRGATHTAGLAQAAGIPTIHVTTGGAR